MACGPWSATPGGCRSDVAFDNTEDLIHVIQEVSEILAGQSRPECLETFRVKAPVLRGISTDSHMQGRPSLRAGPLTD